MWRALLIMTCLIGSPVYAITTQAKQAILIDATTGAVLLEKDADELIPAMSLTKIAGILLVFRELENGHLKEDDLFPVSKLAWSKTGSRMFLEVGTMVRVRDLIKGVAVQSANDASIALAEGVYGNEAIFASEVTRMAHSVGATKSSFKNATGWPDPTHMTTVRDIARLTQVMIRDYPTLYAEYFSIKEYTYNNIRQRTHNALLYETEIRADGVKTGHSIAGGYAIVGSSVSPDGSRFIVVLNGMKTRVERTREALALLKWAEANYTTPKIFSKGAHVVNTDVWLGATPQVSLVSGEDVFLTLKRDEIPQVQVSLIYAQPLSVHHLKAGDQVGVAELRLPRERRVISVPLLVSQDVTPGPFVARIAGALRYIFFGHEGAPA